MVELLQLRSGRSTPSNPLEEAEQQVSPTVVSAAVSIVMQVVVALEQVLVLAVLQWQAQLRMFVRLIAGPR